MDFLGFSYEYIYQLVLPILSIIVVPVVLWYATCFLWDKYNTAIVDPSCSFPLPPGSFGFPFLGETIEFLTDSYFFKRHREKYGSIYKTHLFGSPTIRVIGPDPVKEVLRGENSIVKVKWPKSVRTLLGDGCIGLLTGTNHFKRKRSLMKVFTFEALSDYVPTVHAIVREYVNKWCRDGNIEGYPELKALIFCVVFRLFAGVQTDFDECSKLMKVFDTFTTNLFCLPIDMPGFAFRKAKHARNILLGEIDEAIKRRKANGEGEQTDLFGKLLNSKDSEDIPVTELKNMCLEALLGGLSTTLSTASFLVVQLAKYPQICEKVREELAQFGLDKPGCESVLDLSSLNKMHYVNNVVKEGLRLSPPIAGGFREVQDTFVIGGYQIPAGWTITYAIQDTHETCSPFVDPAKFDPDRWNENETEESKFTFIPFGGGRRICPGKEFAKLVLRIFLVELSRECTWTLVNPNTRFRIVPLAHPVDDMKMSIEARNCES